MPKEKQESQPNRITMTVTEVQQSLGSVLNKVLDGQEVIVQRGKYPTAKIVPVTKEDRTKQ